MSKRYYMPLSDDQKEYLTNLIGEDVALAEEAFRQLTVDPLATKADFDKYGAALSKANGLLQLIGTLEEK